MSKLLFMKQVPEDITNQYLNCGWKQHGNMVEREMETGMGHDDRHVVKFKAPWLVQRGKIKRPLSKQDGLTFTGAITFDYMGSAEFEYGAIPLSLRRIQAQFPLFKEHKVTGITMTDNLGRTFVLRVWANFDTREQLKKYIEGLHAMEGGAMQLKEHTDFELDRRASGGMPERSDIWWDIENDVIWSFDKNFMGRIERHMMASFAYMDRAAGTENSLEEA